jgi:hypothetical protein
MITLAAGRLYGPDAHCRAGRFIFFCREFFMLEFIALFLYNFGMLSNRKITKIFEIILFWIVSEKRRAKHVSEDRKERTVPVRKRTQV